MIRSVIRLSVGLLLVGVLAADVSVGRVAAGVSAVASMFLSFLGGGWSSTASVRPYRSERPAVPRPS